MKRKNSKKIKMFYKQYKSKREWLFKKSWIMELVKHLNLLKIFPLHCLYRSFEINFLIFSVFRGVFLIFDHDLVYQIL